MKSPEEVELRQRLRELVRDGPAANDDEESRLDTPPTPSAKSRPRPEGKK